MAFSEEILECLTRYYSAELSFSQCLCGGQDGRIVNLLVFNFFFSGWHISVYIKTYLKHLELPVLRDVLWLFFSFIVFSSMIAMKRIERNLRALPLKWSPEQRYLLSITVLLIPVVAKCMETRVLIVPGVEDNLLHMENMESRNGNGNVTGTRTTLN